MKSLIALAGGLAGAGVVTLIHQLVKTVDKDAPRMDLLGMQALSKIVNKAGGNPPSGDKLYNITLAGDLITNALYYSAVGIGKGNRWAKGAGLGLAAGIGGVLLPGPLGLDPEHSNKTTQTQALTVLYYFIGGIVTAGVIKALKKQRKKAKYPHTL